MTLCPTCNHAAEKHKVVSVPELFKNKEPEQMVRCRHILYQDANSYGDPFNVYCKCSNNHVIEEAPSLA